MKNSLVVVGNSFRHNRDFLEYVIRECNKKIKFIDSIEFLSENDKDLFLELEDKIHRYDNIIIVSHKKSFATVSKLIATMNEDTLILKDSILIPSKSSLYGNCGFLLELNNKKINALYASEGEKIDEILIEIEPKKAILHIFKLDSESAKILLEPSALRSNVVLESFEFIKGWSIITAKSTKYGELSSFIQSAKENLAGKVIASYDIISYIIEKLHEKERKITFAESCTGGALSALFASRNGYSNIFDGSVVSYANRVKQEWLGVNEVDLKDYGAVSEIVVKQMCEGAIELTNSDYSIAISGIAGPSGGSNEKPVGTVFVGVKSKYKDEPIIERVQFKGDREYVQRQAAWHAVMMLLEVAKDELF